MVAEPVRAVWASHHGGEEELRERSDLLMLTLAEVAGPWEEPRRSEFVRYLGDDHRPTLQLVKGGS